MEELGRLPLRALLELSRRGTMAAVAQETGYTAGAISQQLARLEAVVGQPLLTKAGRGVRLTDAGRVLAAHAENLLQAEEAALSAARATTGDLVGQVTLGVFGSTAAALLAPLVLRLRDDHPGITLRSREISVDESVSAVRRGEVDLAFGMDYPGSPLPRDPVTDVVHLRQEQFVLAVPDTHDSPEHVQLAQAREWPWILTPERTPFGSAIRNACRLAGFEPDVIHEVTDTAAAILLATNGLGITPVTPLMLHLAVRSPRMVTLHEHVERTIVLIRHRADRARPTISAVTDAAEQLASAITES
jgi:DNA-binding transcriptional LysR family regulator